MSKEKSLLKNIGIFTIGTFTQKLVSILLVSLHTRTLTPEDVGYYNLINITFLFAIPIFILQINDALFRNLLDAKTDDEVRNSASNAFSVLITGVFIMCVIIFATSFFVEIKYSYILILYLIFNVIFAFSQQCARGLRKNKIYAMTGILSSVIIFITNALFLIVFKMKVEGLLIAEILANAAGIILIEKKVGVLRNINFKDVKQEVVKKMLKYSVPLLPNATIWWFLTYSNRYFISYFLGEQANGIFSTAGKFPTLLLALNSVFSLAWQESAISTYDLKDRNEYYEKTFKVYMRLFLTSVLIIIPITKYLMLFIVSESFRESWKYIPFLYMGCMFSAFALFFMAGYYSSKKTKGAFFTSATGVLVTVLISLLIPKIGMQAASLAYMLSFFVVWVARTIHSRAFFSIKVDIKALVVLLFLISGCIYSYYLDILYLDIIWIIIGFIAFLIYNKDMNLKIYNTILNLRRKI